MEFEALGLEGTNNFLLWSSRNISDQPPRHVLVLTSLFADNNVVLFSFFHLCCSILLDEEGHIKLTGKALHKNTAPASLVLDTELCFDLSTLSEQMGTC